MSISVFVTVFLIEAALATFLTQAVKQFYTNAGKKYSANMIALVDAVVLGLLVTSCFFILNGIQFSLNNIICMIALVALNWFGSMLGYDKIIQFLKQIESIKAETETVSTEATQSTEKTAGQVAAEEKQKNE